MSFANMVSRRFKSLLAWVFAIVLFTLVALGLMVVFGVFAV